MQGPVVFDENGTRTGLTGIYQLSKLSMLLLFRPQFTLIVKHTHAYSKRLNVSIAEVF